MLERWPDGCIKLFITSRLLHLRRANPGLFTEGEYQPLHAIGANREHVFAFTRRLGDRRVLVVSPRLVAGLLGDLEIWPVGGELWGDTTLLDADLSGMTSIFTGAPSPSLRIGDLLASLPVGVFVT